MSSNQTNIIKSYNELSIAALVMCCLGIVIILVGIFDLWGGSILSKVEHIFWMITIYGPFVLFVLSYIFTAYNSATFCRIIRSIRSNEDAKPCPATNYLTAAATIAVLTPLCIIALLFFEFVYHPKAPYYFIPVSLIMLSTLFYIMGYTKLRKYALNYQDTELRRFWGLTVANIFILTGVDALLLYIVSRLIDIL